MTGFDQALLNGLTTESTELEHGNIASTDNTSSDFVQTNAEKSTQKNGVGSNVNRRGSKCTVSVSYEPCPKRGRIKNTSCSKLKRESETCVNKDDEIDVHDVQLKGILKTSGVSVSHENGKHVEFCPDVE